MLRNFPDKRNILRRTLTVDHVEKNGYNLCTMDL